MTTLPAALRDKVEFAPADLDWLHQLVGDWQLVADMSMADLVLWVRNKNGRLMAMDQCRPSNNTTVHPDDVIGLRMPAVREALALEALASCQVKIAKDSVWNGTVAVKEEFIPVVRGGRAIAVLTRESTVGLLSGGRLIDDGQLQAANRLCQMISQGDFPVSGAGTSVRHGMPRVTDGMICLSVEGNVTYASPNATTCFHRLGIKGSLDKVQLLEQVTNLIPPHSHVDETMSLVLMGRQAWLTELELGGVFLAVRSVPLLDAGQRAGGLLLVRDITELRRREQVLLSKDATIREIHHRVKNNLQTVSALLRMQARRAEQPEAQAALREAERRVATIATVHDALSQNIDEIVDFDEVFGQVLRQAALVAESDHKVSVQLEGRFGMVGGDAAQALVTVLAELVANAVEHGLAKRDGTVTVTAQRDGAALKVLVSDDGEGLTEGKVMSGLGTQIVSTLVRTELHGVIDWSPNPQGGTVVTIHACLED